MSRHLLLSVCIYLKPRTAKKNRKLLYHTSSLQAKQERFGFPSQKITKLIFSVSSDQNEVPAAAPRGLFPPRVNQHCQGHANTPPYLCLHRPQTADGVRAASLACLENIHLPPLPLWSAPGSCTSTSDAR